MCNRRAGQGTTVRVKIPLTLGDHPGADRDLRGRPLRHSSSQPARTGAAGSRAGAHRNRIGARCAGLPVARAAAAAGISAARTEDGGIRTGTKSDEQEAINIVVLQADGRQFGLMVDKINDTQEIVVKPLRKAAQDQDICRREHHGGRQGCAHSGRDGAGAARERGGRSARSRIRPKCCLERRARRKTNRPSCSSLGPTMLIWPCRLTRWPAWKSFRRLKWKGAACAG